MGPYITPNTPPTSLKHGYDMSTIHNVYIYLLVEMGMNSLSVLYLSQSGC